MEFFGIGSWELMVVGLIALIVLGPKQMILLARRAGELFRQVQIYWQAASKTLDAEINAIQSEAGDLAPLSQEFTALTNQIKNVLTLDPLANGKTQAASPVQPEPSIRPPTQPAASSAWATSPNPMAATPVNGATTESVGQPETPASPEIKQLPETPVTYPAWTTKRN